MVLYRRMCISFNKNSTNRRQIFSPRYTSTKAMQWRPTVGLEIHAQIATKTKLFSGASTAFTSGINSSVALFDCAIPGTMPVLNRKCVEAGVLTAAALSCELNEVSTFERKHYFYADLPAGFQITQQKKPLAVNGEIKFNVFTPGVHKEPYVKSSKIKQLQLEQDSGRSLHDESIGRSLIDLNRAGAPLMELVFEPDLTDGEEAAALVKELIMILEILGTCSCKMEEGALRVDANVSISRPNEPLGIRTELKNIGSVRAVAAAVQYEIKRQTSVLEAGGRIVNETRAWDAAHKRTIPMRHKEEKQDYRFMPEANLPPLRLHVKDNEENVHKLIDVGSLRKELPDLPEQIRYRLEETYGLSREMIIVMTGDLLLLQLFYNLVEANKDRRPQSVAIFLAMPVLTFLNKNKLNINFCLDKCNYLGELIDLLQSKIINLVIATKVLDKLISEPEKMPKQIVEENNWYMIADQQKLEHICLQIIEKNPKVVKKYKSGKTKVFKSLLGQVATLTNECADMGQIVQIMKRLLS